MSQTMMIDALLVLTLLLSLSIVRRTAMRGKAPSSARAARGGKARFSPARGNDTRTMVRDMAARGTEMTTIARTARLSQDVVKLTVHLVKEAEIRQKLPRAAGTAPRGQKLTA